MLNHIALQIEIRGWDAKDGAYPVVCRLSNGAVYSGGKFLIDEQRLLVATLDAAAYGQLLFDALMTGPIRTAYQQALELARAEASNALHVRILILDEAAELHALSWERLYHHHNGHWTPLTISTLTPFSRYVELPIAEPDAVAQRPLRMLFAIANPTSLPPGLAEVQVAEEVMLLQRALSELHQLGQVRATIMPGRSGLPPDLRAILAKQGYIIKDGPTSLKHLLRALPDQHILHFLGHGAFRRTAERGEGKSVLLMEDEGGEMDIVHDEAIVSAFAALDPSPRLVFLAACESAAQADASMTKADTHPAVGLAPKLVRAGIPAVVAMRGRVPMDLAQTFTSDFYRNLMIHGMADLALNQARLLLFDARQIDWAIPVLLSRLRENRVFQPPAGDFALQIQTEEFEPETIVIPAGPFLMGSPPGRHIPAYETPQTQIELPAYRIGKFPVTNQQYKVFLQQMKRNAPAELGWWGNRPAPDTENHPVAGVTWYDAMDYCGWLTSIYKDKGITRAYTLPSEAQWEKAARGVDGRIYPWGDEWDAARCNTEAERITAVDDYTEKERAGGSPYGCYDTVGNVPEWTTTLWGEDIFKPDRAYANPWRADGRDSPTANDQIRRVCRGGATLTAHDGTLPCSLRNAELPRQPLERIGFRVVLLLKELS